MLKKLSYISLLVIFISILSYFFIKYEWSKYLIIFLVMVKGFLIASKAKIFTFLKTLTVTKGVVLGIKRWLIDNVLSKWLNSNIIRYIKIPIKEFINFYRNYSIWNKFKKVLLFFIPLSVILGIGFYLDLLNSVVFFAELKIIVIGFFKFLWVALGHLTTYFTSILTFISSSWLAPIIEIFAFSYLIEKLEQILGPNNFITKFFNLLGKVFSYIGEKIDFTLEKIGGRFTRATRNYMKAKGKAFSNWIYKQKIIQELKDIQAFKEFEEEMLTKVFPLKIDDKKKFIKKFNQKNHWNLKIKGIVAQKPFNSLEGDIFLIEGSATHNTLGIKKEHRMDSTDFWVWNTYSNPITISSKTNIFKPKVVKSKKIVFIKTDKEDKVENVLVNGIPFEEIV